MKLQRKRIQVAMAVAAGLLAIAGLSQPGRATLGKLFSLTRGGHPATVTPPAAAQAGPDVEQRARARHGWGATLLTSVARGQATTYSRDGAATRQASLTLYRLYPDRLRVELRVGGAVEIFGYSPLGAWRAGAATLDDVGARDVRAWLRLWPERLFVTRAVGASYREAGRRVEGFRAGRPWQEPTRVNPPALFEQVEMTDDIGLPPGPGRGGDRRRVTYYVNRETWTVEAARWLEPDDPRRGGEDGAARRDVRVDFGDWRTVEGVLWPFEVSRWQGGRVDLRLQLSEVRLNQVLAETLFQQP